MEFNWIYQSSMILFINHVQSVRDLQAVRPLAISGTDIVYFRITLI